MRGRSRASFTRTEHRDGIDRPRLRRGDGRRQQLAVDSEGDGSTAGRDASTSVTIGVVLRRPTHDRRQPTWKPDDAGHWKTPRGLSDHLCARGRWRRTRRKKSAWESCSRGVKPRATAKSTCSRSAAARRAPRLAFSRTGEGGVLCAMRQHSVVELRMCCRSPQVRKLTGKYDSVCVMYEVRRVSRVCDCFHRLARETSNGPTLIFVC